MLNTREAPPAYPPIHAQLKHLPLFEYLKVMGLVEEAHRFGGFGLCDLLIVFGCRVHNDRYIPIGIVFFGE